MDKVSIVMPAYNSEKRIHSSIESVLKQTHQNLELLIINDGSTDRTEEIILGFKKYDKRIKYFKIQNSGSATARNVGLDNSTGDYIAFVDSDDYIEENMIELLLRKSQDFNADIVSCSYKRKLSKRIINEKTYLKEGFYNKKQLEVQFYNHIISNPALKKGILPDQMWTKLYKKELIERNNIRFVPELRMGQDLDFSRKCLLNANSFYYLPNNKLYVYVANKSSRTNTYLENAWVIFKEINNQSRLLSKKFPKYNLEKQISHDLISKAMTAIANIAKYEGENSKDKRLSELKEIIYDSELQNALNKVSFKQYNIVRKIIAILMKNKKITLIYYGLKLYRK